MVLSPRAYERSVPAKEAKYQLHGRTYFAAPILEMAGHAIQIDGEVVLSPEAGETNVVKGELSADHSAIWVENETTGAQLGNKLLISWVGGSENVQEITTGTAGAPRPLTDASISSGGVLDQGAVEAYEFHVVGD